MKIEKSKLPESFDAIDWDEEFVRMYKENPEISKCELCRHYIHPNYDVFEKEQSDSLAPSTYWQDLLQGFVADALFAQIDEKPIELLTANEKLGICIGAGIPLKYEDGKISTTYNVGFALIDGKYRLFYNNEPLNNSYC